MATQAASYASGAFVLPPGPRAPAAAQLLEYVLRPLPMLERCRARHGDAFTLSFPVAGTMCFFTHPDDIRAIFGAPGEVLRAGESNGFMLAPLLGSHSVLVLDGAEHLRERRLLLPPFHGERMRAYAGIMRDAADESLDGWPVGRPFALQPRLQAITLEIIVRAVFGIEESGRRRHLCRVIARLLDGLASPALLLPAFLRIDLWHHAPWLKTARAKAEMDRILYQEIAARRAARDNGERHDVLTLLLSARDEQGRGMSDEELRDELVTLLVAGHETTATALAWAFERLAASDQAMQRLTGELAAVLGDRPLDAEQLGQLVYLDAVVKETLRLRPVVPLVGRLAVAPFQLGRWCIPAGVRVMPLLAFTHQRPDLYPEPTRFRPERFLERPPEPYGWLPFGGGRRRCLGMAFALYEMKVVLATVLRRARIASSGRAAAVARRHITLAPADGARIVLTERAPRTPSRECFR